MSLRIIGGAFRNRPLKSPKGDATRPTLAVMRKAIFDILQTDIDQANVLDLYAGSGAMGLEALSRGAAHTTFVEIHRQALTCIEDNCRTLQVTNQSTIMRCDGLLALKKLAKAKASFDVVFVDPPYALAKQTNLFEELLAFFETHSLLNPQGRLFLEEAAPPRLQLNQLTLHSLYPIDTRTFSRSALHQFRRIH
jgi:16S rRNA (guanine966-N2)-methyltransferase